MAFDLLTNNALGLSVVTKPAGVRRDSYTFMTLYDYAQKYKPDVAADLFYANGKGSITGMLTKIGSEGTYASDIVKHAELTRLHNRITGVTFVGNTFTSPTPHNVQPNMVVLISDGVKNHQAYVDSVTSPTVFVALSKKAAGFGFTGTLLDISVDFSNTWDKASGTFVTGNTWNPKFYENNTQIIKWRYDEAESDMAHDIWFDTPEGPRWTNTDIERSNTLFDNIVELTHFFSEQVENGSAAAVAGAPKGMKCVTQQIAERGNIINGFIEDKTDLEAMAKRIIQQGVDQDHYYVFCNIDQMNRFNTLAASISPSAVNQYGSFPNGEDMAVYLDFSHIMISGKHFWFKHWKVLDDPTILASGKFETTGFNFIAFPMGNTRVKDGDGNVTKQPFLRILHRAKGEINRKRKVEIFGPGGTAQLEDKLTLSYLNESTNQVVGANAWFLGNK